MDISKILYIKQYPIDDNSYKKNDKYEDDLDIRENMTVELAV